MSFREPLKISSTCRVEVATSEARSYYFSVTLPIKTTSTLSNSSSHVGPAQDKAKAGLVVNTLEKSAKETATEIAIMDIVFTNLIGEATN